MKYFLFMIFSLLGACSYQNMGAKPLYIEKVNEGIDFAKKKMNLLYQGDPNLAGVIIYQSDPVNMENLPPRDPADHPLTICYYFWNTDNIVVHYNKKGKIDSMHPYVGKDRYISFGIKRYSYRGKYVYLYPDGRIPNLATEWQHIDFRFGSDPKFRKHRDPRIGRKYTPDYRSEILDSYTPS